MPLPFFASCCWGGGAPDLETPYETLHELPPEQFGRKSDRQTLDFSELRGKVVLVVNVASLCGLTRTNYKELVPLYEQLLTQPFEILAFPCAQFLMQEPRGNDGVHNFCERRGVKFPVLDKCSVNGKQASEVYDFLKVSSGDMKPIEWNFGKFLVGKDGKVIKRYSPKVRPALITPDIHEALKAPDVPTIRE